LTRRYRLTRAAAAPDSKSAHRVGDVSPSPSIAIKVDAAPTIVPVPA